MGYFQQENPIMANSTSQTNNFSLSLPITQRARRKAQEFAAGQPTPQKAEQVSLNTLAVCVVNDYLQMMGIPTDLTASDSSNPVVRLCADVADLEVTGVGRLECRPIRADQQTCYMPPEVWSDRIGYVVVQLDEPLMSATILGFAPTAALEQLPINQLQPLENLLAHLSQLMQPVAAPNSVADTITVVNLSQWLQNVFETGWQTVEALLGSAEANLAFSFRKADSSRENDSNHPEAGVRRAKLIDLGIQLAGHFVTLIVELRPESTQKSGILVQVHPTSSQNYLPPLLQLIVLDESGAIFLQAQARGADNYIQLQFNGKPGERFSVKVALGDVSITENFVI
jgi:hypothetical protein